MTELLAAAPVVLSIVLLVALGVAGWGFVTRAGRLVAQQRETDVFRSSAQDLTGRILASLDGVAGPVDALRRGSLDPEALAENLAAGTDALDRYLAEAQALPVHPGAAAICAGIEEELSRAARAIEMIEHGRAVLAGGRTRARLPEAQTSIKRGYLGLLHAREAIAALGERAAGLRPVQRPRLLGRGARGSASSDHRM
jgi:hypothetical protein